MTAPRDTTAAQDVTLMLHAISRGEREAAERLLPVVYSELRRLAESRLSRLPEGQTLQATALVHEAYLRLIGDEDPGWNGRGHFFGAAAMAMRDILVEQARRKSRRKHGGGRVRVDLGEDRTPVAELGMAPEDLLDLDAALTQLHEEHPRAAQVVNLRFYAGLTNAAAADALGLSTKTIEREWRFARAWLHSRVRPAVSEEPHEAQGRDDVP